MHLQPPPGCPSFPFLHSGGGGSAGSVLPLFIYLCYVHDITSLEGGSLVSPLESRPFFLFLLGTIHALSLPENTVKSIIRYTWDLFVKFSDPRRSQPQVSDGKGHSWGSPLPSVAGNSQGEQTAVCEPSALRSGADVQLPQRREVLCRLGAAVQK